jgi:hypothetical protein
MASRDAGRRAATGKCTAGCRNDDCALANYNEQLNTCARI